MCGVVGAYVPARARGCVDHLDILRFTITIQTDSTIGRWLEHCRNHGDQEPRIEFSRKSNAYVPVWKPHKMTFVRMIDCEISNSRTEAVNVWRGARLEMIRCWIHSCGQGVSVSHFLTPTDLGVFKEFQVTPHVSIRECLFENIAKKDWSSAISIGRFVTLGADQSSLTKTLTQCTYRGKPELNGQIGLVVELFHNTLCIPQESSGQRRYCLGNELKDPIAATSFLFSYWFKSTAFLKEALHRLIHYPI